MIRTLRRLLHAALAQPNASSTYTPQQVQLMAEHQAYITLRAEVQRQHGRTRDVDEARKRLTTEQLKREINWRQS